MLRICWPLVTSDWTARRIIRSRTGADPKFFAAREALRDSAEASGYIYVARIISDRLGVASVLRSIMTALSVTTVRACVHPDCLHVAAAPRLRGPPCAGYHESFFNRARHDRSASRLPHQGVDFEVAATLTSTLNRSSRRPSVARACRCTRCSVFSWPMPHNTPLRLYVLQVLTLLHRAATTLFGS